MGFTHDTEVVELGKDVRAEAVHHIGQRPIALNHLRTIAIGITTAEGVGSRVDQAVTGNHQADTTLGPRRVVIHIPIIGQTFRRVERHGMGRLHDAVA